ncbi:MAG: RidA family protein [Rickettsiaceae bacterium H1]|nr:RidA family protein [Rickettsiaceae bacterium H1]
MTSIKLPSPPKAVASYEPYVKVGNLIHISGQIPIKDGKLESSVIGKLGEKFSVEEGRKIAEICTLNMLSQLNDACGGQPENTQFSKVKKCVKLNIFVNSTADFIEQPLVANAVSETILQHLGPEKGKHARAAVGVYQLPKGVAVEVDGIFEI